MCKHQRFFRIALQRTSDSDHSKYPMSAVLVKGSRVLAVGTNKREKTHSLQLGVYGNRTIHAELDCLIKAGSEKSNGSVMYVSRKLKDGSCGLAKPCVSCRYLLRKYGVSEVYYTLSSLTLLNECTPSFTLPHIPFASLLLK